ncbi:DNA polymerase III subunit alpha [Halobacillus sp. KCTC 3957]|uniref:DNA polymerase III subunit alpha n=1 Tax=Halobacillus yeomjeoni TaxID=311194 RepID=A0A931HV94_9BACI|nr:DNA polymerase III subunit alpha [Halobacillus yeomjeoni]
MSFTHLNVQTGFSLMDSTVKIEPLVERAKVMGYRSLAITDNEVMSGAIAFYEACKRNGIKPLIGMKVHIQNEGQRIFPTLLFARNETGYQNLLKISSWIQTKQQSIDLRTIINYQSGLTAILMTAQSPWAEQIISGQTNELKRDLEEWLEVFPESRFYLSIQDSDLRSERQLHKPLKAWAEEKEVGVVALGDVKYVESQDALAFHSLKAIKEGRRLTSDTDSLSKDQYLKPPGEMEAFFKDWWPESIEATQEIADSCDLQLSLNQTLLPNYPLPGDKNSDDYLRELCYEAIKEKYPSPDSEIFKRLDYELDVITSMNFSDYFLIVWDFISYARNKGIHAGPGRGSAAGSIVAYLLNITQVDPIEYRLLFERFLNPERVTMPDIDIDFPDHRRDEVIQYVAEKYGSRHVAQICTFGTFAARSVLRELFKTMAIDDSDAAFVLKHIPKGATDSLVALVQRSEQLKDYIRNSETLKALFQVATKLEGLPRHVSTHAAGVIISEDPLVQHTALMKGQGNVLLTQLPMGELEHIGLLKIDFLGLRNLTFLERMEQKIQKHEDKTFTIQSIPMNDSKAFHLLKQGRTNGVFQLESQGMKSVLKRLRPSHFEDVVAVNALYRPGPMEYISTYIDRKHGRESIHYPHPDIKPILQPTFGVLVYQEQIMQVAQTIAGYSLGQADILRRAVSKKQARVIEEQREGFIRGAKAHGYADEVAHEVFQWIVKFSNYGFNRSHAVAYSVISYRLAYLKAHYPSYFLAELINSHIGDKDKLAQYIREAKELGVVVKAPSINRSGIFTRDDRGEIQMGLLAIKGVGYQAAQAIIEEREKSRFKHLNDFCLRVVSKTVSRSVIESLILAGAFDELHSNRASVLASIDQALEQGELFKEFQDQPNLFGDDLDMGLSLVEVEPFPILKQLSMEKEVLGTYLSEHPLHMHRKQLRSAGVLPLQNLLRATHNKDLKTAAVVETLREIRTKRGDPMAFLTISDESSEMEAVLFPDTYRTARRWIQEQMLVSLNGKTEERSGKKQMIINEVHPFKMEEDQPQTNQRVFIRTAKSEEEASLEKVREVSTNFPGNTPIYIVRAETRTAYRLDEEYSIHPSREALHLLSNYFGKDSVAIRSQVKSEG